MKLFNDYTNPVLEHRRSKYIQDTVPLLRLIAAGVALLMYLLLEPKPLQQQDLLTIIFIFFYAVVCFLSRNIRIFYGKHQYIMLIVDQLMIFLICCRLGGLHSPYSSGFILPILVFANSPAFKQFAVIMASSVSWLILLGILTTFDVHALIYLSVLIILIGIFVNVTTSNDSSVFTHYGIHDGLTGLYTQRYFYEHLDILINDPGNTAQPFSLILIDLNGFKSLNDTLGHVEGDRILKDTAATIKRTVRDTDVVCRYGGDEFVIILPGVQYELCQVIKNRLRTAIREMGHFDDVSIGSALYPDETTDGSKLVALADSRMYLEKRRTRKNADKSTL